MTFSKKNKTETCPQKLKTQNFKKLKKKSCKKASNKKYNQTTIKIEKY